MSRLDELKKFLEEQERNPIIEDFPNQNAEYRRQRIVEIAVEAADDIIMEGSDGSVEETDYLTSAVTQKLMAKVHGAFQSKLLRSDIANPRKS